MSDLDVLVGRRIVAVEDGRGPVSADWVTLVLDDGTRVDFSTVGMVGVCVEHGIYGAKVVSSEVVEPEPAK
jgi:hypothetical protein